MIRYNDCEFPRFTEPQTKATKQFAIMTHRLSRRGSANPTPPDNNKSESPTAPLHCNSQPNRQ